MKYLIRYVYVTLFAFTVAFALIGCSGSNNSQNDDANPKERAQKVVSSNNFNEMTKEIDKAIAEENFAFAFAILNSIPSHFDKYSRFYYNKESGEMGEYNSREDIKEQFTVQQYCRKAVSVLKAESDVLLTKNDPEAESLFLEHLADFDLGVNKVNLGEFYKYSTDNEANEKYQEAVTIYNDYLISVIRKALSRNNPDLAKKISLLVRDGLSFTTDSKDDYNHTWAYDTEAKDEAEEIIRNFNAE